MPERPTGARWTIVAILTGLSLTSYLQRMNISIAAKFMTVDLGLTQVQMGQIFSSFLVGYTIFQIPAGIWGDRYGPRRVLALSALGWGIATVLTGLVAGAQAFALLLAIRFALGAFEASTYPVAAGAVARWVPKSERALAFAIVVAGLSVGSTVTPPLVSWLMVRIGWRESFYLVSIVAFLIAGAWWAYGANEPPATEKTDRTDIRVFKNRDVMLLSLSYFFNGYIFYIFIFWLYTYLIDVRGFTLLKGGLFAALPFIASSILTPIGGATSDRLLKVWSRTWARRVPAIAGLTLAGLFMIFGALVNNPYLAIAGLALSIGFDQFAEPEYWAATMDVAGPQSGTATGILNMMGNLGGVVSTALVPVLVKDFGWVVALGSGAALAFIAALVWLVIRCEPPRST